MANNVEIVRQVIEYVEDHLTQKVDLETLAQAVHYSKYHLHRMFTSMVGYTVYTYVQRRKLTEAAKLLIFSDRSILDIALLAGYESQQSFSAAFRKLYRRPPHLFREQEEFFPLQLKFVLRPQPSILSPARIESIRTEERGALRLIGNAAEAVNGFQCVEGDWDKLCEKANSLSGVKHLIRLNDYGGGSRHVRPRHYAAVEMERPTLAPPGMVEKMIPASRYVVFTYRGNAQEQLHPVMDYIYKVWFAESTSRLNESARFDFAQHAYRAAAGGCGDFEVWVPIV